MANAPFRADTVPPVRPVVTLATAVIGPDGRVQAWSEGAESLTGYPDHEIIGRHATVLADRIRSSPADLVGALLADGDGGVRTDWLRSRDGTCRSVSWHPLPVQLADGKGLFAVVVSVAQPVNACDAVAADRLLDATPVGLAVLDRELRFRFVNKALARLNGMPVEAHLGRFILEVLDLPDPAGYESVLRRVLDQGETVDNLRAVALRPDGTPYAVLGSLFPLRAADGAVAGVAGFVHELVEFGGELLDAAESRRRLELLDRVGGRLGQGLDPRTVATELASACVPDFAGIVRVDLLESTAGAEGAGERPGAPPVRVHPLNSPADVGPGRPEDELPRPRPAAPEVAECVSAQRCVVFEADAGCVVFETDADGTADAGTRHGVAVPLITAGTVLGAVTFLRRSVPFGGEDVLLAREITARAATAIDNALLYRRERRAAFALQRHLLPATLPSAPWSRLAHRYRPAEDDTLAGGDWYDGVALPGARIGLSIGDVTGHGLEAAAAMGRYRSFVHALLAVGMAPGQLLTQLDGLLSAAGDSLAATCACVVYDSGTGRCRVALAGHPPPLLIRPDGSVGPLECEPGPPLGMDLRRVYADVEYPVPPGSLLVLYTDGMIEDRAGPLDLEQGIALLGRSVRDPNAPLADVCEALMSARPTGSTDDAAILVARLGRR